MIKIKDLDYSLSLKLGDPVQDHGDGQIFDWADRLKYLERAYARLMRILPKLMRSNTPLFANSYDKIEMDLTGEMLKGNDIVLKKDNVTQSFEKLEELFITVSKGGIKGDGRDQHYSGSATFITPDKYYSVLNGANASYTPSVTSKKFYYTYLTNKIFLLPVLSTSEYSYTKIYATYKKDSVIFDETNPNIEIPILNQYIDLIIILAANEGMQDLGRQDKVGLYTNEITGQLNILSGWAQQKQQEEGSDING